MTSTLIPLTVEIVEAKPNNFFTEAERSSVRFLRFSRSVPCAECCKRRTALWTMLCAFRCMDLVSFKMLPSTKHHAPLTAVCQGHILMPDWPEAQQGTSLPEEEVSRTCI